MINSFEKLWKLSCKVLTNESNWLKVALSSSVSFSLLFCWDSFLNLMSKSVSVISSKSSS